MKKFQLRGVVGELRTAQSKAPNDAADIFKSMGGDTIWVNPFSFCSRIGWMVGRLLSLVCAPFVAWKVPRGAKLFVQYPDSYQGKVGTLLMHLVRRWRRARIIMLVHDLSCLRAEKPAERTRLKEVVDECLGIADVLIVHNRHMRQWMGEHGYQNRRMVDLVMFDYLTSFVPSSRRDVARFDTVMIPGFLASSKAAYLSELKNIPGVEWHLYGIGYDSQAIGGDNVHYHGSFPADQLPAQLTGAFGLVWDGDSVDEYRGVLGEYQRYNNPHKFSLFMAAGVPVVVCRQAAIADVVRDQELGVVVDSLRELTSVLQAMTAERYEKFVQNVGVVSHRVRNGEYLREALASAEHELNEQDV